MTRFDLFDFSIHNGVYSDEAALKFLKSKYDNNSEFNERVGCAENMGAKQLIVCNSVFLLKDDGVNGNFIEWYTQTHRYFEITFVHNNNINNILLKNFDYDVKPQTEDTIIIICVPDFDRDNYPRTVMSYDYYHDLYHYAKGRFKLSNEELLEKANPLSGMCTCYDDDRWWLITETKAEWQQADWLLRF